MPLRLGFVAKWAQRRGGRIARSACNDRRGQEADGACKKIRIYNIQLARLKFLIAETIAECV